MDMNRLSKIPKCGSLPDPCRDKIVVGAKQLRKAMGSGSVRQVYLAHNADPAVTDPIAQLCSQSNIHISWVPTMAELGSACGIEVGAAAAAVLNS